MPLFNINVVAKLFNLTSKCKDKNYKKKPCAYKSKYYLRIPFQKKHAKNTSI